MSGLLVDEQVSLIEVLDRTIHKGVVLHGSLVLGIADIDLIYLRLELLLASVDSARKLANKE